MIRISVKVLILTFCFWLKTFLYPWPLFKKTWAHLGKATSHLNDGLLIQRETAKHKGPWAISLENICIKKNSLPPSFSTQLISTVVLLPSVTQTWIGICLIQPCSLEKRAQVWLLDVNNWNNAAQRIKICKSFLLLAESAPTLWVSFLCVLCPWQWGQWDIKLLPSRDLNAMGGVHEAQSCSELQKGLVQRSPCGLLCGLSMMC